LAFVISIPIAWYAMHEWLQILLTELNYNGGCFAGAGLLAILIANVAIGYQSIKASIVNPVDSLKSE